MFYLYNGMVYKKLGVLKTGKVILQCLPKPDVVLVVDPSKISLLMADYIPASNLMFR